jgi:Domain of unknown function (DUF4190)
VICSLCAAENPIDGRYCQACGALLQGQRGIPLGPHDFDASQGPYTGPEGTSGKAVASLVCGLIIFFFPSSIAAIVLGHWALGDMRRSGGRLTGRGMAKTGLLLGYAGVTVVPILILAAVLVPYVLRARTVAKQAAVAGAIRKILNAENEFDDSYANGFSPSLATLGGSAGGYDSCDHAGLIDDALAAGNIMDYQVTYRATGPDVFQQGAEARGCTRRGTWTFEIHAEPTRWATTEHVSFFADQTGVIRYSRAGRATANSPRWRPPIREVPFALSGTP